MGKSHAKVLEFDIETSPILALVWELFETNVLATIRDWHMMSFAYKWYGEKTVQVRALPDYRTYKKDRHDDRELVLDLWNLFNEADIIIGHNGDSFDIKKSHARFIYHGLTPPPPHKTIDTLKMCRKHFKFSSNKLNEVGKLLGVGQKERTGGFALWQDCLDGDMKAWAKMKKYNKQDVVLLDGVYEKLRPWMTTHPNLNVYDEEPDPTRCPACKSPNMRKNGWGGNNLTVYQKWRCADCGRWARGGSKKTDLFLK